MNGYDRYWGTSTPDSLQRTLLDRLARSSIGTERADRFAEACSTLLKVFERSPSVEWLAERKPAIGAMLRDQRDLVKDYMDRTVCMAEDARDLDDYMRLCQRRSVIQIFLDEFEGSTQLGVNPSALDTLDAELRFLADREEDEVNAEFLPRQLPPTHWWWRILPGS